MPSEPRLILSLFDRLTDNNPKATKEVPPNEWQLLADLKSGIAHDLTNLLNTRISEDDIPQEFSEIRDSILAYGVQDFAVSPLDRESIKQSIERSIRVFEPRLSRVKVEWLESHSSALKLHYRIWAFLRADYGNQPLVFDAELPAETRQFKVNADR